MESIIIPEGVTTIEGWAFSGCTSLRWIVIPASVENIEQMVFAGDAIADDAQAVYYGGASKEEWNEIRGYGGGTYAPQSYVEKKFNDLLSAHFYCYSETDPGTAGNYWRFVDGVPAPWGE